MLFNFNGSILSCANFLWRTASIIMNINTFYNLYNSLPPCCQEVYFWCSHSDHPHPLHISMAIALWVRLNVKQEIGKFLPHPSFYLCPNISDRFPPQASHYILIQIFQIYLFRRRDEHFSISNSHLHAKETFVNQLRKEKGTSWTLLKDPNIWCNQVVRRFFAKQYL